MRLVCLADLHDEQQVDIPDGHVLIVAGDICRKGNNDEIKRFDHWLARLPHQHKLVIAGNHDRPFAKAENPNELIKNGVYLQDSGIEINGFKFWGSPWQPRYFDGAFDLKRGPELSEVWRKIPVDTDVLITHTPPFGILDRTRLGKNVGCKDLAEAVQRIKPKAHIFGHIHESAGIWRGANGIFVNSSIKKKPNNSMQKVKIIDI
jgi:Icc-related predicted phosphoesterase